MNVAQMSARVDELNNVAEHVPAEVLARRLAVMLDDFLAGTDSPASLDALISCFGLYDFAASTESAIPQMHVKVEPDAETEGLGVEHYQRLAVERYDRIEQLEAELESWRRPSVRLEPETDTEPEVLPELIPEAVSSGQTKLCKVCGPEVRPKPVSEFGRHGRSKDGYAAKCGECGAEGRRRQIEGARKSRSGEAEVPVVEDDSEASEPTDEEPSKPCVICLKPKPLTDYLESGHSEDGRQSLCADCRSANGRRGRESSSFGQPGEHSLTPSAVTTIPRAEPVTREERFCSNAEECVGFGHIGRPTKLNMLNKTGVCHACEDRDRDRNLSGRVGRRST